MLRKTITTVMVLAGFASVAFIPAASARTAGVATTSCPPGTGSSGNNYCEPHCVVPQLVGYSLSRALIRIQEGNCRLGHLYVQVFAEDQPPLTSKFFPLFDAVRQFPSPGTILPVHAKVTLYVKFH